MFKIILKNYDYKKYQEELKKYSCNISFYPEKPTLKSSEFYSGLLKLSNNRCYMCGYTLETNHENTIYIEREHLINKKIEGEVNSALLKCKNNLVPICRVCNSQKITVPMSTSFKEELKKLELECETSKCDFNKVLNIFKEENFDFNITSINYKEDSNVEFDILLKTFMGDEKYINQFSLNTRTENYLKGIMDQLYDMEYNNFENISRYLKNFSMSSLDDEFIDWLFKRNLLKNENLKKRNNLLETITLLENI